jgi:hypothetical protein
LSPIHLNARPDRVFNNVRDAFRDESDSASSEADDEDDEEIDNDLDGTSHGQDVHSSGLATCRQDALVDLLLDVTVFVGLAPLHG